MNDEAVRYECEQRPVDERQMAQRPSSCSISHPDRLLPVSPVPSPAMELNKEDVLQQLQSKYQEIGCQ